MPPVTRILQVVPVLRTGGLERVASSLSLELHRRGHRVVVCSQGGDPFEPVLRSAGVEVRLITRPRPRPLALLGAAAGIARAVRRESPEVVHAHNPAAAAAAALARALAGKPRLPIVTTYHGVMPGRVDRAARAMELVSSAVVGVGPTSTAALLDSGLPAQKARTILNAVDVRVERTAAEVREEFGAVGAELIVTVGRYAPEKNHALLLEAVTELARRRARPVRTLLVGVGLPEFERQLAADLVRIGAEEIATITGRRSDAPDIVAAADVFCLSSDSEGLPLVLLEAMSVGTPVVSTDAGGVRDVVVDGETGLLVPVRDRDALVAALERVLDDAGLRERLAASAQELVASTTSLAAMTDAYEHLYDEVARRAAASRRTGASPST